MDYTPISYTSILVENAHVTQNCLLSKNSFQKNLTIKFS